MDAKPIIKPWMTDEILDQMEDRCLAKNDQTKYKALDKTTKTKIRKPEKHGLVRNVRKVKDY
ncbi:MAG: hypothetical protein KTM48_02645, partial [Wolbachia endosymbiont of Pissodes strobi]|nr:hypothetical protein [Wolbachia endosymbiont of Pissodes strobi]